MSKPVSFNAYLDFSLFGLESNSLGANSSAILFINETLCCVSSATVLPILDAKLTQAYIAIQKRTTS